MIAWLKRKLFGAPKPKGPAHLYAARGSMLAAYYGADVCMYCGRKDPEHAVFTEPPCTRRLEELA